MSKLTARLKLALLYISLSKNGRVFLKKAGAKRRRLDSVFGKIEQDAQKACQLMEMLRVCDRVFCSQVSGGLCRRLKRDRRQMYERFIPYAWFSLLMWSKMLEAFGIKSSRASLQRCCLVAFTHREWNDLFDNRGYSFEQLYAAFDPAKNIAPELEFLRQLKQMDARMADPGIFVAYYRHLRGFRVCSLFEYTREKSEIILDEVAPYVARLFIYAMQPAVPQGLEEAVKPVARWLYMLDELADLEQDRKMNRVTFMMLVSDPAQALRDQLEKCRQALLRPGVRPQEVINFMEMITSRIIQASNSDSQIELKDSLGL